MIEFVFVIREGWGIYFLILELKGRFGEEGRRLV